VQRLYQWLTATGRMNPQAVGAQQGGEQVQEQQLQRIQSLVNSPQFKQLPEKLPSNNNDIESKRKRQYPRAERIGH